MTADWLHRHDHHRPDGALGSGPPVEYRVTKIPSLYFCVAQKPEGFTSTKEHPRFTLKHCTGS